MAFRAEVFGELCSTCKEAAETMCLRCGRPLCQVHAPEEDSRCFDCEAYWSETGPDENPLGRWGKTSNMLIKAAKWTGAVGGLGFALILLGLSGLTSLGLLGGVLMLIGFPVAAGCVAALPLVRAAERSKDRLHHSLARRRFLAERKHPALPSAPVDQPE